MALRAGWWSNTFNPATGYQQARKTDGSWVTPFNPISDQGFAQGHLHVDGAARRPRPGRGHMWRGRRDLPARHVLKRADGSWATGGDALRYDPTSESGIHTPWIYNELGQPRKT